MMRRAEEWGVSQCSVQGSSVQITAILEQGWAGARERESAKEVEVDHDWTRESPDQGMRCKCQLVDGLMKMEREKAARPPCVPRPRPIFSNPPPNDPFIARPFSSAHT